MGWSSSSVASESGTAFGASWKAVRPWKIVRSFITSVSPGFSLVRNCNPGSDRISRVAGDSRNKVSNTFRPSMAMLIPPVFAGDMQLSKKSHTLPADLPRPCAESRPRWSANSVRLRPFDRRDQTRCRGNLLLRSAVAAIPGSVRLPMARSSVHAGISRELIAEVPGDTHRSCPLHFQGKDTRKVRSMSVFLKLGSETTKISPSASINLPIL